MEVEAPASKRLSFGVHVFVSRIKPDWWKKENIRDLVSRKQVEHDLFIEGKEYAYDDITDSILHFRKLSLTRGNSLAYETQILITENARERMFSPNPW
jgi:hypothetical protein